MKAKFVLLAIANIFLSPSEGKGADCPKCPKNDLPCHEALRFSKPCRCSTCLTYCDPRNPICLKGKACVTEPMYFGSTLVGDTAKCVPFKKCLKTACDNKCPKSGYFVDVNGCSTCLCQDPCLEMGCKGCIVSSSSPGREPKYECS